MFILNHTLDHQINFLFFSLFLDTICFSNEAHRFNEIDVQIVDRLEHILKDYSLVRKDVFNQLEEAKNSIDTLTFKEILQKDMKLINPFDNLKVITSSISGQLVCDLLLNNEKQEQILNDLKEFSNEHNYSLILIMAIKGNGLNSIQRDMAIYSSNDNLLKKVIFFFLELSGSVLFFSKLIFFKISDFKILTELNFYNEYAQKMTAIKKVSVLICKNDARSGLEQKSKNVK